MKKMDFPEFCDKMLDLKLTAFQKRLYKSMEKNEGKLEILQIPRRATITTLRRCVKAFKKYKQSD